MKATVDLPNTEIRYCVNGCTSRDRHTPDCPVGDTAEAWVLDEPDDRTLDRLCDADRPACRETWRIDTGGLHTIRTCNGCQPRQATDGWLCSTCHRRARHWLSSEPEQSLVWAHAWLGDCLGGLKSTPTDRDRVTGTVDRRPAMNLDAHDHRTLITDQLMSWTETVCDQLNLHGPDTHTIVTTSRFLNAWLNRIEDLPDIIQPLWTELKDAMARAHEIAPWRPHVIRETIRCPECDRKAVSRYGGLDDYHCRGCNTWYDGAEWETWRRLTAFEEHRNGGAA